MRAPFAAKILVALICTCIHAPTNKGDYWLNYTGGGVEREEEQEHSHHTSPTNNNVVAREDEQEQGFNYLPTNVDAAPANGPLCPTPMYVAEVAYKSKGGVVGIDTVRLPVHWQQLIIPGLMVGDKLCTGVRKPWEIWLGAYKTPKCKYLQLCLYVHHVLTFGPLIW